MRTCNFPIDVDGEQCGKPCEGNTKLCASHSRRVRQLQELARKESEKRTLKLSASKPKRTRINQVSAKRKGLNAEYEVLREQFLNDHPVCEVKLQECEKVATDVHHKASGFNKVTNLNNTATWLACCRNCHHILHNVLSAKEARSLGLKI